MPSTSATTASATRSRRIASSAPSKDLIDPTLLPLSPRSDSLPGGQAPATSDTAIHPLHLSGMEAFDPQLHSKPGQTITPPEDGWGIEWPMDSDQKDAALFQSVADIPEVKSKATSSTRGATGRVDKRDKYREKNRVAAAKCRAKKKEHIDDLEDNHRTQSMLNSLLKQTAQNLRDELSFWRTQALQHGFCDCTAIQEYNMRKARALAADGELGHNDSLRDSVSEGSKRGSIMFQMPDDFGSSTTS